MAQQRHYWPFSNPLYYSWSHAIAHLFRVGTGGRVLHYHGANGRTCQGLFCDMCGEILSTDHGVLPISDRLGAALVDGGEALSLVRRMAYYQARHRFPFSVRFTDDGATMERETATNPVVQHVVNDLMYKHDPMRATAPMHA